MLLKKGADMKIVNNIGDTVLHKASQHNSIQCAKHLVAEGIDINVLDKMKKTGNIPHVYYHYNEYYRCSHHIYLY